MAGRRDLTRGEPRHVVDGATWQTGTEVPETPTTLGQSADRLDTTDDDDSVLDGRPARVSRWRTAVARPPPPLPQLAVQIIWAGLIGGPLV